MIGVEILEASSLDEYLAYMSYEAKQEQRAERFALLREAAGQNAAHNQRSGWDDYDDQLVPDAEAKLGALLKFEPAQ